MHGAVLIQSPKQHADGVVEVDGVHSQPFEKVLSHWQPHSIPDIAAAKGRLDVQLEGQSL